MKQSPFAKGLEKVIALPSFVTSPEQMRAMVKPVQRRLSGMDAGFLPGSGVDA
ncbi:hypothetical protein ABAC402_01575 [Asticcacaulis sp. AC402]|nr:hypothetical protein ABAC402_01575 [Asticcacaulis sp. AC402]